MESTALSPSSRDTYLKQQASQDLEKRVAAVIVATPDGRTVAGYYTHSQYAIAVGDLPADIYKRLSLPKYPVLPATRPAWQASRLDPMHALRVE